MSRDSLGPGGRRLALDPGVRRVDDGRVLIGGSPLRVLRLTAAGARAVEGLAGGEGVPDGLARRLLDAGMAHPRFGAATLTRANVTVVIPVRNDYAGLHATLTSLGTVGGVIVVDDGSAVPITGDGVIRRPSSGGPAAARNTGWRTATTPLVAFVDANCLPAPGWLEALLPHFDDAEVAAVAPRVTSTGDSWLARYETTRSPLDRGPAESPVRPRSVVPFVPSTALVIRRDALDRMGGFDENLRFGEDVDLIWRLVGSGATVRYEPRATATHPTRASLRTWARQRFDYGTSAAPLAARHGSAVTPLAVSRWSAAAWALIGLGAPLSGSAVAGLTTALLARRLQALQHPWTEAARLAGLGHLYAGRQVADAVRRVWWPLAVAGLPSRRVRRALVLALIPLAIEWYRSRPPLDPARWIAVRILDDVAYGAGVWAGCIDARSGRALVPDLSEWPGRNAAVEPV